MELEPDDHEGFVGVVVVVTVQRPLTPQLCTACLECVNRTIKEVCDVVCERDIKMVDVPVACPCPILDAVRRCPFLGRSAVLAR